MIIGVPREIKPGEQRVALTPAGVRALVEATHRVIVERGAGAGSSIRDEEYTREGATTASADEVWAQAEMILKVKEPIAEEYPRMRPGQILFTYLHLAPSPSWPARCKPPTASRSPTRRCSAPTAAYRCWRP